MKLHAISLGEADEHPPLIILHGLFGSGRNWLSMGKQLAENQQVFLLDLRNHGLSPHTSDWNYQVMSDDILQFFEDHNITQANLLGHSMGGKVAMTFAQKYPNKVHRLIVVDIGPGNYPTTHQELLQSLIQLDLQTITSRMQADKILEASIREKSLRQFLLSNLYRNEDKHFAWRCNLKGIMNNIKTVGQDLNELFPEGLHFNQAPTLFIRGEHSEYIDTKQEQLIKMNFPKAQITTITEANHWVHVEQPERFLDTLNRFLAT